MKKIFSLIFCSIFVFFAAKSMEVIDQINVINEPLEQKFTRAVGYIQFLKETGRFDGKYIILSDLNLDDNFLRTIISDLHFLSTSTKTYKDFLNKIQFIDLRNNNIQHLPREIFNFSNLKVINLRGNSDLSGDIFNLSENKAPITLNGQIYRNFKKLNEKFENSRKKPFAKTCFLVDNEELARAINVNIDRVSFCSVNSYRAEGIIELINGIVKLGVSAITSLTDVVFKRCGCVCNKQGGCTCLCGDKSEAATAFASGATQSTQPSTIAPTTTEMTPTTPTEPAVA
ncbi:MAG: hypothetical protein WC436_00770 [Candidatus Babeliales bacterium]